MHSSTRQHWFKRHWARWWPAVCRSAVEAGYLLFPSDCAACGSVDAVLCTQCENALRHSFTAPFSASEGADYLISAQGHQLLSVYAAAAYRGEVSAALLAYKNHGAPRLRGTLARGLGRAVAAAIHDADAQQADTLGRAPKRFRNSGAHSAVLLIPIPTSTSAFARRGFDPLALLLRHRRFRAALRAAGLQHVGVLRLLAARWRPSWHRLNQKTLGKARRGANISGAFTVRQGAVRSLARWQAAGERPLLVLVDDVLTTGATLREAARELANHSVRVRHAGVLAAVGHCAKEAEDATDSLQISR